MPVTQLIYLSSALEQLSDDALDKILESAVRHNTVHGVTGMLLYSEGNFLQVLEGSESAIDQTYQRICQDSRHANLFLVSKETVPEREFSAWSMGFRRLTKRDAEDNPAYAPLFENGFDPQQLSEKSGMAADMMREFRYLNR